MEGLKIGDQVYSSRLLIGSSGYPNFDVMLKAIKMSEANIVTVAIRRVKLNDLSSENLYSILKEENCTVLPNTAGCYTAKDAVLTAQLAREALGTDLIKLEVIGDVALLAGRHLSPAT